MNNCLLKTPSSENAEWESWMSNFYMLFYWLIVTLSSK